MQSVTTATAALAEAARATGAARRREDEAGADLLRAVLVEVADEHPGVVGFEYSAHWQYDDEGSYYWSILPQVIADRPLGQRERRGSPTARTYTITTEEEIVDGLCDRDFGIEVWRLVAATENSESPEGGSVTVGELRAGG